MGRIVQGHIPGLARRDKQARPPKRSEAALQGQARGTLANLGYGVMDVGQARPKVKCPCGCEHVFTPKGYMGNALGFPDMVAFRWTQFPAVGILLELKRDEKAVVSPQQAALAEHGRTVLCKSLGDVVRAVQAVEEALDAYRLAPARREQISRFLETNKDSLW